MSEQMAATLLEKLNQLPTEKLNLVSDFVEFLMAKEKNSNGKGHRVFGSWKGMIEMSPDFDEPLEDFKEYM
jgi:hypothetical protein